MSDWGSIGTWGEPEVWDGSVTVGGTTALGGGDPGSASFFAQVLAAPDSYSEQDVYHATLRYTHKIGSWLQILDEDERPLWEMDTITDGGVSFDISNTPDRSLDITVLDTHHRLLSGAPSEEAAEARRFVRAIYAKQTPKGWFRFPMFTGPLSSGGVRRQGAEVQISAAGKESLYLEPFVTWEVQHFAKGSLVVDALHDLAYSQGERRFRLPELPTKLQKRFTVPRFSEAWKYIRRLAGMLGRVPYFDGEGYLCVRPQASRTVAYVFDPSVVLTAPEIDDDYTNLINQAFVRGPDPDGPVKPISVTAQLPPPHLLSPQSMARSGVPRRAVATDEVDWEWHIPKTGKGKDAKEIEGKARDKYVLQYETKKRPELVAHAKALLQLPTKSVSFDALPVPHLRPGMICRIHGEYEGQDVDERFILRSGYMPLTPTQPMTIGSWRPIGGNWWNVHTRRTGGGSGGGHRAGRP